MQAIPGPWPSLIREIQSIVLADDGFGEQLDWGHDRGRDFQCLATILCLIDSQPNTAFPGPARLEKWLSGTAAVPVKHRNDALETFKIFIALVQDRKLSAAFRKPTRVSPIEFTMTAILIYHYKRTHSLEQISRAISQMRADVREKFQDIRANGKVLNVMLEFVKRNKNKMPSDENQVPAMIAIKSMTFGKEDADVVMEDIEPPSAIVAKSKTKVKRRKRFEPVSSDDSELEAAPTKRRASMPEPSSSRPKVTKVSTTSTKAPKKEKISAPSASKATAPKKTVKPPAKSTQVTTSTSASVQTGRRTVRPPEPAPPGVRDSTPITSTTAPTPALPRRTPAPTAIDPPTSPVVKIEKGLSTSAPSDPNAMSVPIIELRWIY